MAKSWWGRRRLPELRLLPFSDTAFVFSAGSWFVFWLYTASDDIKDGL
jgi:hypothetical protein